MKLIILHSAQWSRRLQLRYDMVMKDLGDILKKRKKHGKNSHYWLKAQR